MARFDKKELRRVETMMEYEEHKEDFLFKHVEMEDKIIEKHRERKAARKEARRQA